VKVLFVQPLATTIGGCDSVLLQLVHAAKKLRPEIKFSIALPPGSAAKESYIMAGVEVFELKIAVFIKNDFPWGTLRMLLSLPGSCRGLEKIIRKQKIDLVHSHKINVVAGALAAHTAGVPAVHTYHEVNTGGLWIYRLMHALIERNSERIIILCDESGKLISKNWRKHSKVQIIYNGIDITQFYPEGGNGQLFRKQYDIPENSPIITAVSRIQYTKGLEYFIEAAAKILITYPDAQFLIVGDVISPEPRYLSYKKKLQTQIYQLGINNNVHLTGIRRDVNNVYAASDIFVLPSIFDIFPTTILEAMAMALPIVATRVGGVPEQVIDAETGFLVNPADSGTMADQIMFLIKNPDKAKQMGLAGRKRVVDFFTAEQYATCTLNLYDDVLNTFRQ